MRPPIEHQTTGPCAAGMALEQQRAAQSMPTLFDEVRDDGEARSEVGRYGARRAEEARP